MLQRNNSILQTILMLSIGERVDEILKQKKREKVETCLIKYHVFYVNFQLQCMHCVKTASRVKLESYCMQEHLKFTKLYCTPV